MTFSWTLIIGFVGTLVIGFMAGLIAKLVTPGRDKPHGFVMTMSLGILGAVLATYVGQALGWYGAGEGKALIGGAAGAAMMLLASSALARRRKA